MKYKKKPVIIDATPWFKNGDHPLDHLPIGHENPSAEDSIRYSDYKETEGKIVRYYRHPQKAGTDICPKCKHTAHQHGWVDTLEGGHVVCVGDFIITGLQGEHYPCKPDIFKETYEPC